MSIGIGFIWDIVKSGGVLKTALTCSNESRYL